MTEQTPERQAADADSRRDFLNRAGRVAVVAPAAALLLAASTRVASADAFPPSGQPV